MKILSAEPIAGVSIETDEEEYNCYTRYGPDCWFVRMGESDETFYDCEELEELYQQYVNNT